MEQYVATTIPSELVFIIILGVTVLTMFIIATVTILSAKDEDDLPDRKPEVTTST